MTAAGPSNHLDETQLPTEQSAEALRRQIAWTAVALAALMLPLGLGFASREQFEWIGKGGRGAHPTIWSAVLPHAASGAFSLPYVMLAILAERRARATGYVAQMLAWAGIALATMTVLMPSAWGVPLLVWIALTAFSRSPVAALFGIGQLALVVGIILAFGTSRSPRREVGRRRARGQTRRSLAGHDSDDAHGIVRGSVGSSHSARRPRWRRRDWRRRTASAAVPFAPSGRGCLSVRRWCSHGRWTRFPPRRRPTRTWTRTSVWAPGGTIYAAFAEGTSALEQDGHVRWANLGVRQRLSKVVPSRDTVVYVGGANGVLYALRARDGAELWSVPLVPTDQVLWRADLPQEITPPLLPVAATRSTSVETRSTRWRLTGKSCGAPRRPPRGR